MTELATNILNVGDDLIYVDPPFNWNRDYNVNFKDESGNPSDAQLLAFEDTWHRGPSAESDYAFLTNTARHEGRVPREPRWASGESAFRDGSSQLEFQRMSHLVSSPRVAAAALFMSAILAGCSSASPASSPSTTPPESTSPSAAAQPYCPEPYRGPCLGPIPAGTYTTVQFQPPITYTVPVGGWSNWEDLPGMFLLLPPGFDLAGVDAGGSDYIGIYTSVVAANADCTESEQPNVGHTAAALAAEFAQRAGLTTTTPTPVSVGGLQGLVLDIRLADGWTQTCFYSGGNPVVPLIRGVPPSDVDNPIGPGFIMRLYLLERSGSTLAIELGDYSGGTHLDAYSAIVDELHFGS